MIRMSEYIVITSNNNLIDTEPSCGDLMNTHISKEYEAALLYLNFSGFCYNKGYTNISKYFIEKYKEETEHALEFFKFVRALGYKPSVTLVTAEESPLTLQDLAIRYEVHEASVTSAISGMLNKAQEKGNNKVVNFLLEFMEEQTEEDDEAANFSKKISALETEADYIQFDQAFEESQVDPE